MLTALAVLFAIWLGSGFIALAACVLSSRISRVEDLESLSALAPDVAQPVVWRKAS